MQSGQNRRQCRNGPECRYLRGNGCIFYHPSWHRANANTVRHQNARVASYQQRQRSRMSREQQNNGRNRDRHRHRRSTSSSRSVSESNTSRRQRQRDRNIPGRYLERSHGQRQSQRNQNHSRRRQRQRSRQRYGRNRQVQQRRRRSRSREDKQRRRQRERRERQRRRRESQRERRVNQRERQRRVNQRERQRRERERRERERNDVGLRSRGSHRSNAGSYLDRQNERINQQRYMIQRPLLSLNNPNGYGLFANNSPWPNYFPRPNNNLIRPYISVSEEWFRAYRRRSSSRSDSNSNFSGSQSQSLSGYNENDVNLWDGWIDENSIQQEVYGDWYEEDEEEESFNEEVFQWFFQKNKIINLKEVEGDHKKMLEDNKCCICLENYLMQRSDDEEKRQNVQKGSQNTDDTKLTTRKTIRRSNSSSSSRSNRSISRSFSSSKQQSEKNRQAQEMTHIIELYCKHMFHKKCAEKWLRQTKTQCPMCRVDFRNHDAYKKWDQNYKNLLL